MTVIVSVKINDGVVMASDSASTFGNGQIYLHTDKIFNLYKGLPFGAMVTGAGGIGFESIATLMKDFRARLDGTEHHDWQLDRSTYTMKHIAERLREYLFEEKLTAQSLTAWMKIRLCGYSAGAPLAEVWEVFLNEAECDNPKQIQSQDDFGLRWDGEYETLNRMVLGFDVRILEVLAESGASPEAIADFQSKALAKVGTALHLPSMPIQDAIDLAEFLVQVCVGYIRFSVFRQPKSVGGSVEIASITKHEGFRWVKRRHFYRSALNP